MLYFVFSYMISVYWYKIGYFSVVDIFFDTDPASNIKSLAHGVGRNALSHAFLEFFTVPVRILEFLFASALEFNNPALLREYLSLAIAPCFSALTLVYFYRCLVLVNTSDESAILLTMIYAFSITNLLFSIIPETYSISCFLITYLIYYYLLLDRAYKRSDLKVWILLGVLLAGVTITNLFIFLIVYAAFILKGANFSFNTVKNLFFSSIVCIVIVVVLHKLSLILFTADAGKEGGVDWIAMHLKSNLIGVVSNFLNLFSASINAIFAFEPKPFFRLCSESECNALTFARDKDDLVILGLVGMAWLLLLTRVKSYALSTEWQSLYIVCGLILLFNFSLHTIFGREMFMYTKHWITPLFLILVPLCRGYRALLYVWLLTTIVVNLNFLYDVEKLAPFI